tara:strand:- start:5233 stop:5454 length:222 start_codon:yes stop_codon:yes gene_type:complete
MIIGRTIESVELMNDKDTTSEGWSSDGDVSAVIILSDKTRIYASCDYEGNGPGALFLRKGNKNYTVYPGGEDE